MALTTFKRLHYSHYGAVIRDSTHNVLLDGIMPARCVESSTVMHLVDPQTSEELLLIGTCNMSTKLAHRTKALAEKFKPNAVFVQAAPYFAEYTKIDTKCAQTFHEELIRNGYVEYQEYVTKKPFTLREIIFQYRKNIAKLWLHHTLRVPENWYRIFLPGLEMKFAAELAQKQGTPILYAGDAFGVQGMEMLRLEKDFDVFKPLWRYWCGMATSWVSEVKDVRKIFTGHGLKDLTETFFNKDQMAWFVRFAHKIFPAQTDACIHKRSEDLFIRLESQLEGKKKLAVVNQWHMEDIEKLWRKKHGIEIIRPPTSGTEDLPLAEIVAYMKGTDHDRHAAEKLTGTTMATESRQNVPYFDENRSHYG
ncbi:unnamed protein product [Blepharisma stoltei]|uniref:Uncharacterized protein n=1 Tax=Blepharisma stoltei TaxID=1481888 RepID=A0AAU9J8K0_9CILI|nr:unnamed protein product [Blepharisma stoltei]